MADTVKRKTINGILWASIQKFGTVLISFGSNIVLARLLTPDDFGCIGMLAIFIALANTFIDGGFGSALIQKTCPNNDDYNTVFTWNLLLSIILYSVLYIGAPYIASFYNMALLSDILRVVGLSLIINALYIVQMNILRKRMEFKILARINIISAIVSVIVAIICALKGLGVWALVIQQISFSLSCLICSWTFSSWRPKLMIRIQSLKELFSFGSYILVSSFINSVANNLSGILIGKYYTAKTMGYFSQAQKIENVSSTTFSQIVDHVSYPMFVEVKYDRGRLVRVVDKLNNTILAVVMPLMYLLALLSNQIIYILFGANWAESAPILEVLAFQGIFVCVQNVNYNAVAALGKSKSLFNWTIIKRLVSISVLFLSLSTGKLVYMLWAMVFNSAFIVFCNSILIKKFLRCSLCEQFKIHVPVILMATIPFIIGLIIRNNIVNSNGATIFIAICYIIIYISLILIFKIPLIKEVKELINNYKNQHQNF